MYNQDEIIRRAMLLGFGLDTDDEHKRITRGENFLLLGGSDSTHKDMQDEMIEFNKELRKRVKTLDQLTREEIMEIAHKLKIFGA
ncbi:MAG: hypothetical protein NUW37_09710 [Planctomycetes bacterium]|nr:hypothetical protein [Planctomycetota bacterium]